MEQDLRNLFEKERKSRKYAMKSGHEDRFLERLTMELPKNSNKGNIFFWVRIAASVVLVFGLGAYLLVNTHWGPSKKAAIVEKSDDTTIKAGISLGDLSPDLEKIEHYYVSNINYELSQLNISDTNKDMVDGFMERLGELDAEYKILNGELNDLGPNDETITALIQNLQLRLQLLQKLKQKLNQLKSSENEQKTNII